LVALILAGLSGPAAAGKWAGLPVDGWVKDFTLSTKGGYSRFLDPELRAARLVNGYTLLLEGSWN
jgi:hypothetical protein